LSDLYDAGLQNILDQMLENDEDATLIRQVEIFQAKAKQISPPILAAEGMDEPFTLDFLSKNVNLDFDSQSKLLTRRLNDKLSRISAEKSKQLRSLILLNKVMNYVSTGVQRAGKSGLVITGPSENELEKLKELQSHMQHAIEQQTKLQKEVTKLQNQLHFAKQGAGKSLNFDDPEKTQEISTQATSV
jgi:beta-xylosidase